MNASIVDERSPLLNPSTASPTARPHTLHITPALEQLALSAQSTVDELCANPISNNDALRTAEALVVLLLIFERKARQHPSSEDVWEQSQASKQRRSDLDILEHSMKRIWEDFTSSYRGYQDIEVVLWHQFILAQDQHTFHSRGTSKNTYILLL